VRWRGYVWLLRWYDDDDDGCDDDDGDNDGCDDDKKDEDVDEGVCWFYWG